MRHVFCRKVVFLLAALLVVCGMSARKPIKTLLITGQNNHNWQVSHVVLKQILENSGRFSVDFAVSPEAGKDMSGFVLDFSPYELVVLDYNGDAWPEETNRRFLEYVRGGGGVVVYHAADNAFVNWPEYNKICALGGWENRDEKAGPYVYWSDGKLIKDSSAGVGGSHGKQHENVLNARNHEHLLSLFGVIAYPWILVEFQSDAVTADLPDYGIAIGKRVVMHCLPHISEKMPRFYFF